MGGWAECCHSGHPLTSKKSLSTEEKINLIADAE